MASNAICATACASDSGTSDGIVKAAGCAYALTHGPAT